jgi:hypothetical protein
LKLNFSKIDNNSAILDNNEKTEILEKEDNENSKKKKSKKNTDSEVGILHKCICIYI